MLEAKISTKGQVVIPKEFREAFKMKPGTNVMIEMVEEGVLLMPSTKNPVEQMTGMFKGRFKKSSVELVKELRHEWDKKRLRKT